MLQALRGGGAWELAVARELERCLLKNTPRYILPSGCGWRRGYVMQHRKRAHNAGSVFYSTFNIIISVMHCLL